MKRITLMLGLALIFSVALHAQTVETDRDLSAPIYNYKTFAWMSNIDKIPSDKIYVGPNGVLVYNNQSARSKIKDAIKYELEARGYKFMNNTNADFYVTFNIMEQPATLTTYNGYKTASIGLDTFRTQENIEKTAVDPGTVLINFIDSKTNKQVWQGFASGILKPQMVNDQAQVKQAISAIFREYNYTAAKGKK